MFVAVAVGRAGIPRHEDLLPGEDDETGHRTGDTGRTGPRGPDKPEPQISHRQEAATGDQETTTHPVLSQHRIMLEAEVSGRVRHHVSPGQPQSVTNLDSCQCRR